MKRFILSFVGLAVLCAPASAQNKEPEFIYGLVSGPDLVNATMAESVTRKYLKKFRIQKVTDEAGSSCHLVALDKVLFVEFAGDNVIVKRVQRYKWRAPSAKQLEAVGNNRVCPAKKRITLTKVQWEKLKADEDAARAKIISGTKKSKA